MHDVRYAIRTLGRSPLYAALVALTLAVGIGPTTAIFSVVHALLLRPLPYRDPDSLVNVWRFRNATDHAPVSGPDFADFRDRNTTLAEMASATRADSFNVGGIRAPLRVEGARVTANFFSLLGAPPALGALPSGAKIDGAKQVVLGYRLWQQSYGGADVIGKQTRLNGEPHTIVAVMPEDFGYPARAEAWVPYDLTAENLGHRAYHRLHVVARLRPGVTVAHADADMKRIAKQLGNEYPDTSRGIGAAVSTLRETVAGDVRRPLLILLGAVAFLLFIACSNVANLALTRAATRRKDLAVRMAIGASTGRVARQLLTESVLLSAVGGALGLPLAWISIRAPRALGGAYFANPEQIRLDPAVLAFNFTIAILTGVAFGFAPLLTHGNRFDALRSGDRAGAHGGRDARIAREAIVVAILSFSFVLLIGAGLLVRSFLKVRAVDIGVRTDHTMTLRIYLPETKYPSFDVRNAFFEQFLQRMRTTHGVDAAATISGLPLENSMSGDITFPNESDPVAARRIATFTEISPGFLAAAGVPLIAGREFTWDDIHRVPGLLAALDEKKPDAERVPVLVNETYANLFGRGKPLGQELLVGGDMPSRIIGVVGDVKQSEPTKPTPAHVYMPLGSPLPMRPMNFILRSRTLSPRALSAIARETLRTMDPDVPPYRIRTMDEVVAESIAGSRFEAVLLMVFAGIALLLATMGIYGVISYNVTQRTRELAIRMAIGASAPDVLRLILARVGRLAAVGVVLGALGALTLTRWLDALLFQVSSADPLMFVFVASLMLVTALIASSAPAHRAARLEPMEALRSE
jgi:putative ABC transport system permease protein